MDEADGRAHTLDGLPAASLDFVRVLDRNRNLIAKQSNITPSELRALFRVAEAVIITPKALAQLLEMTTGAITAISTRLVDTGLLTRVQHPTDRRSLYLELTPAAHKLMEEMHRDFRALIDDAAAGLSASQRASLTASLSTLVVNLEKRTSAGPPDEH